MTANVSEEVVGLLEMHGIRQVFGIPGVDNLSLYQAIERSDLHSIIVRNEATAGLAADAYQRVSGEVAASLTTGGPGVAYAAVGLGESMSASSSYLHLATCPSASERRSGRRRGIPHWFEGQETLALGLSGACYTVTDASSVSSTLSQALSRVKRGSDGPVFVEIGKDLLGLAASTPAPNVGSVTGREQAAVSGSASEALGYAWTEICQARRPVIWFGTGALGCEDLALRLAEQLGAPVLITLGARRRFSEPGHQHVVAFPPHEPAVGELLAGSDCVLALGSDMDLMALPSSITIRRAIVVNRRVADLEFLSGALTIGCEVREALNYFLAHRADHGVATEQAPARAADVNAAAEQALSATDAGGYAFTKTLDRVLPPDAVLVSDMCVAGYWAAGYMSLAPRRQLLYPGWGTLGFGLGAAIGSACARPAARTVLLSGDGGIQYLLGELATIREHFLPITIVVVDDGGYGMLRAAEADLFHDEFATTLRGPDPQGLRTAFDIPIYQGTLEHDAERVLCSALSEAGPSMAWLTGRIAPPAMAMLFKQP